MKMKKSKILSFQGIRGIAILLIILSHCTFGFNQHNNPTLMYAGGIGVELFIIMSGFLAYYSGHNYMKKGLKDRIKKFYPLFFITFLLSIPISMDFKNIIGDIPKIICNLLLINAWIPKMSYYFSFNAVSWYLSLVVFFVICTPFIIKKINLLSKRARITVLIIDITIEIIWSIIFINNLHAHYLIYICPIIRLLDYLNGFLMGSLLINEDNKYNKERPYNNFIQSVGLLLSFIAIVLLLYLSTNLNNNIFLTIIWIVPSMIIIGSAYLGRSSNKVVQMILKNKPILFIGNISLELFLIHQLVIRYGESIVNKANIHIFQSNNIVKNIIYIIIAIVFSYLWHIMWNRLLIKKKVFNT